MHIGLPNRSDMLVACAALALLQAGVLLRFLLAAFRRSPDEPGAAPPVEVVIPCAGSDPGLARRLEAVLGQDYGGPVRFLFVSPSRRDPCWETLEAAARRSPRPAAVLASERRPRGRSGKIEDLLFALENLAPESRRLVFADADVLVPPGWLRALTAPLADPGVGAATAAMLYVPRAPRPGALLRLAWTAFGLPFFAWAGNVTGQSWAIRRADFEALGLRALWERSLYEDLALTPVLRRWGKEVRFVPAAVPVTPDDCTLGDAAAVFNKWIRAYRFYDARTWAMGALVTLVKAWALAWAFVPPARASLALLVWGMDAAFLCACTAGIEAAFPGRFEGALAPLWLWAALTAPFLQALFAVNYAASLLSRDIRWGGRTYRVHAPQRIEVLDGDRA